MPSEDWDTTRPASIGGNRPSPNSGAAEKLFEELRGGAPLRIETLETGLPSDLLETLDSCTRKAGRLPEAEQAYRRAIDRFDSLMVGSADGLAFPVRKVHGPK